ncbi:hypothetical protein [Fodinibius sediminis]|uniref:Uncharacterized protein n=1 Tax=Fodinibius sediminis TaxID=1214077 RepID=A0A521FIN7_9BACT|nr:hypothetical protein [Fodinibius sediminis]SMO95430.1 hypothetical protein SAMN06265218_1374 [Fodinibius sediminis]
MSKDKKSEQISFGIRSFEVLSYFFEKPEKKIRKDRIGYNIQFKTGGDPKKEHFWIDIKATGQYGKQDPLILGEILTRSIFYLHDSESLFNDNGTISLPDQLITTLLSIAYSTTRGAFATKAEGNILAEAIMPLVDPKQLLESSKTE